jgi:hypothetical protein
MLEREVTSMPDHWEEKLLAIPSRGEQKRMVIQAILNNHVYTQESGLIRHLRQVLLKMSLIDLQNLALIIALGRASTMEEDYKVHLYHDSKGKPDSKKGPIDVTIRASSADDAIRQAKAQNPGYHVTASPVKKGNSRREGSN